MAAVIRKYHPAATATMWSKLFNKRYAAKKRATTSTSVTTVFSVAGIVFFAGASAPCVFLVDFVISSFDLSLFVDIISVSKIVVIVNTFLYFHSVNSGRIALMILRKCPLCHC